MTKSMSAAERLLLQNKAWAQLRRLQEPDLFDRLSEAQDPRFLWIGCSDSRVPAETITGAQPGEIFVHRNIANVVVHTDLNLLSVLVYAVDVLKVDHVIVCGHQGCGGIRAAMTDNDFGILNMWLRNIKDVYADNLEQVKALPTAVAREDRLIELNAQAQLQNLAKTAVIQRAWQRGEGPSLHAWVYGIADGVLKELKTIPPGTSLGEPFQLSFST
jgi:carbonic anhydrase